MAGTNGTKECACFGCHNQASLPADINTAEDIASAVVLCDDCEAADCDPFEQDVVCRADHGTHETHVDGCASCDDTRDAEDDALFALECPTCGANQPRELGALGNRMHFRCRNCGMDWSTLKT